MAAPTSSATPEATLATQAWWKRAVVYQVYPRSFSDANGDGIGDLRGLIDRIDYLAWLGIDVIWLSPVYPSPQDDNGYDISDYRDIDPLFGSLADFDELIEKMHAHDMRLLMDLVVNHTSDEHPWFIESRSSRNNPKRDWYYWRDRKADGSAPNNWQSRFSGSAWEHDEATDQSYLHLFSRKQPDLNWENPELRGAVYDMMRWWLDRGVDGFRMDVINFISKVDGLPDATGTGPSSDGRQHYIHGPRLLEFLSEMRREVFDGRDKVLLTVGETPQAIVDHATALTDEKSGALNMVFQFAHMQVDQIGATRWAPTALELPKLKAVMGHWQDGLAVAGWNSLYFNNHDQPRALSRWGNTSRYHVQSAKAIATILHMHRGTPYVYQGEEIGMTNPELKTVDDLLDIQSRNYYLSRMAADPAQDSEALMRIVRPMARDNARSPVQWDAGTNAGFTTGTPWMAINPNYKTINVETEKADPNSVLHHYRHLIALRHENDVIAYGSSTLEALDDPQLYIIIRALGDQRAVMLANVSSEPAMVDGAAYASAGLNLVSSNYEDSPRQPEAVKTLRPWEALVFLSPAR
ncbi:alpha-glucosidase [Rhizobium sp. P38BS-XIX]|uniref:alpha-glucosidase n=1 Tax=Rhizobium sp. P38BS-XIX TaxID=2726740 RepID=UPI00145740FB|nr:alpha-glucosidase [Rhizobium sp. P38BS-XIX]NLS00002.1 alpha-glucosidase [Rhizobium sp. P38BS-XIX]